MPKPSEDVQDLKRCFARLARLDGRPLACAEGLVLFDPRAVRDPRPLLRALEAGPPPIAAVTSSLELGSPPLVLTVSLLAAAQRDLRILEEPRARQTMREEPRLFRRHGDVGEAWIERRRAQVGRLAERHRSAPEPVPWFARALDAIAVAHGEEAARVVAQAVAGARGGALDLGDAGPPIARLVAGGLPVDDVRRLAALGRARDLTALDGEPETAAAYASFACALVPHYAALGLEVPLTPEVFERLRQGTRQEDLAVLAVCLMKHHSTCLLYTSDAADE